MYKKILIGSLLITSLSGCAGAVPWNKQNWNGINETTILMPLGDNRAVQVERIDGKGREIIEVEFVYDPDTGKMTAKYRAGGVTVDTARLRAEVEKVVAAEAGDVAPGITDSIMNAIIDAIKLF